MRIFWGESSDFIYICLYFWWHYSRFVNLSEWRFLLLICFRTMVNLWKMKWKIRFSSRIPVVRFPLLLCYWIKWISVRYKYPVNFCNLGFFVSLFMYFGSHSQMRSIRQVWNGTNDMKQSVWQYLLMVRNGNYVLHPKIS